MAPFVSATTQVLGNSSPGLQMSADILEQILVLLDFENLIVARETCHRWYDLITNKSILLKRKIFLAPDLEEKHRYLCGTETRQYRSDGHWKSKKQPEVVTGLANVPDNTIGKFLICEIHPVLHWIQHTVARNHQFHQIAITPQDAYMCLKLPVAWEDMYICQPPVRVSDVEIVLDNVHPAADEYLTFGVLKLCAYRFLTAWKPWPALNSSSFSILIRRGHCGEDDLEMRYALETWPAKKRMRLRWRRLKKNWRRNAKKEIKKGGRWEVDMAGILAFRNEVPKSLWDQLFNEESENGQADGWRPVRRKLGRASMAQVQSKNFGIGRMFALAELDANIEGSEADVGDLLELSDSPDDASDVGTLTRDIGSASREHGTQEVFVAGTMFVILFSVWLGLFARWALRQPRVS